MYLKSDGGFLLPRRERRPGLRWWRHMSSTTLERAPRWCAPRHVRGLNGIYNARAMLVRVAKSQLRRPCASAHRPLYVASIFQVSWQVYSLNRGAIALIDTRMPGRHARGASYVSRYLLARAKMACAAPGPRPRNDLQNAQRVGARSGIADARTMCFCAPLIGSKTMRVCIISRGRGEGAAVGYLPD